jgi:hypothetical protein
MNLEVTHMKVAAFAERVQLPVREVLARAERFMVPLVRENGEWWISRQVLADVEEMRERAIERDLRGVKADLERQGFTGERLDRELADVSAYLRGVGRGVTR